MGRSSRIPRGYICETNLSSAAFLDGNKKIIVNLLKLVLLTIFQLVKQICLLPKTIEDAVKQRKQQLVRNELEAERLDRIRNPSKYAGK